MYLMSKAPKTVLHLAILPVQSWLTPINMCGMYNSLTVTSLPKVNKRIAMLGSKDSTWCGSDPTIVSVAFTITQVLPIDAE